MATKALNYTAAEINQRLNLAGTAVQPNALNDYYTKTEVNGKVVVDLSTRYNTSYVNLSAALTALNSDTATDASAIKKGGVSIKFINSTTNKYEQWNLKASSWSINTSDWVKAVDSADIPINKIESGSTQSEEEALLFETDGGVQVGKIDANGADFTNLKRGGQQVARMSDLPTVPTLDTSIGSSPSNSHTPSTKAVKDYVDDNIPEVPEYPIETETSQSEEEEVVFGNDEGTQQYAKVSSEGVRAVAYKDMQGNNVIPTKDTTIGDSPSQTNVPTSKAVADYVAEHGGGGSIINNTYNITNNNDILLKNGSVNIGNASIRTNVAEIEYAFGNSITVEDSVSDKYVKISLYSKPTISALGSDVTITFPTNFTLSCGNITKSISLQGEGIKSIPLALTNRIGMENFTYAASKGSNVYISDSVDIKNGKLYFVERVTSKTWHTGDTIPTYYLSNKPNNALVDGCTIYVEKEAYTETEIDSISYSVVNSDTISTNDANVYIELQYLIAKQYIDNPFCFMRLGSLTNEEGLNVLNRNLVLDEPNKILYFCGYSAKLYKIDVSNPNNPTILGSVIVNNEKPTHVCSGVAINGNYLYVVDRAEGVASSPSYLTILNRNTLAIIRQINLYKDEDANVNTEWGTDDAQSPCSCYIYKGYLYICENSCEWDIFDITTNPENPTNIYHQTYTNYADKRYREYQRATFWNCNGHDYVAFAGFSSGVSIWNIDIPSSPSMIGKIALGDAHQCMDVLVDYPYLYIPCNGSLYNRFNHSPLSSCVIAFDISDLSVYTNGVSYASNPSLYHIASIPYKYWADCLREGDPAPTRLCKIGDLLMVNYSDSGIAIFRLEGGLPRFINCLKVSGSQNTCQTIVTDSNGIAYFGRIYGNEQGIDVYHIGNINY